MLMTVSDLPLERIARGKVRDVYAVDAGPLLRYFVGQCSCKSAPGLVHCEKRGEADESHHTGTKSGAGTAHGG